MRSEIHSILAGMRSSRRAIFDTLQGTPESRMGYETTWANGPMDVRFMFLRFADHEEEHALQVSTMLDASGFRQSTVQRILAAAEVTRGDLLATLLGWTDRDLDVAPSGEWPLRRTLAHIIQVERSYTRATVHSTELFQAGQPWVAPEPVEPEAEEGNLTSFIQRMDSAREAAIDQLSDLPDDVLGAPSRWADQDVDVRFRLMRFAHHEREHTAHILKWRQQIGRVPTEAQHLLGLAWRVRGVLTGQLLGAPDDLLDQAPTNANWPLRRILEHVAGTEHFLKDRILGAQ